MFCAPRRMLEPRTALATSLNAVNGGQTAMSTAIIFASSIFKSCTKVSASATVLFIFQFPAMISRRSVFISTPYCHHQKLTDHPQKSVRLDFRCSLHRGLALSHPTFHSLRTGRNTLSAYHSQRLAQAVEDMIGTDDVGQTMAVQIGL